MAAPNSCILFVMTNKCALFYDSSPLVSLKEYKSRKHKNVHTYTNLNQRSLPPTHIFAVFSQFHPPLSHIVAIHILWSSMKGSLSRKTSGLTATNLTLYPKRSQLTNLLALGILNIYLRAQAFMGIFVLGAIPYASASLGWVGGCPEFMDSRHRRVSTDAIDNCSFVIYRLSIAEWQ